MLGITVGDLLLELGRQRVDFLCGSLHAKEGKREDSTGVL